MHYKLGQEQALAGLSLLKTAAPVEALLAGLRRMRDAGRLVRSNRPLFGGRLDQVAGVIPPANRRLALLEPDVRAAMQDMRHPGLQPLQGRIYWPRGNNSRALNRLIDAENEFATPGTQIPKPQLSGAGNRAVNALVGNHEMRELTTPIRQTSQFASHNSPRLVAHDFNAMRRLTGPGADEAVSAMRTARQVGGDGPAFDTLLGQYFGPQAVQMYGSQGTEKIPKALVRRLGQRYAADVNPHINQSIRNDMNLPTPAPKR